MQDQKNQKTKKEKQSESFYEFDASHVLDSTRIPYTEEDMRLSLLKFMIAKRQPNL